MDSVGVNNTVNDRESGRFHPTLHHRLPLGGSCTDLLQRLKQQCHWVDWVPVGGGYERSGVGTSSVLRGSDWFSRQMMEQLMQLLRKLGTGTVQVCSFTDEWEMPVLVNPPAMEAPLEGV